MNRRQCGTCSTLAEVVEYMRLPHDGDAGIVLTGALQFGWMTFSHLIEFACDKIFSSRLFGQPQVGCCV